MARHPFCVAVFIAHFVTSRHFPNFNGFGAYYSETATLKSITRQIRRGNYTQTGLLQWFRGACHRYFKTITIGADPSSPLVIYPFVEKFVVKRLN